MKKFTIIIGILCVVTFGLIGCKKADTNQKLAKEIEQKSTQLVYSVESMDSLEIEELSSNDETIQATTKTIQVPITRTINKSAPKQNRMRGANPKKTTKYNQQKANAQTKTQTEDKQTLKISTQELGTAESYTNELINQRSEVMLLCSKLRNGEIKLTKEKQKELNNYLDLLNATSNYLQASKTKYDINEKTTLADKLAIREKLAIRQAKLQTSILAMDEILKILKNDSNSNNTEIQPISQRTINNQPKTLEEKTDNKPIPYIGNIKTIEQKNTKQNGLTTKNNANTNSKEVKSNINQKNNLTTKLKQKEQTTNINTEKENGCVSIKVTPIHYYNTKPTNEPINNTKDTKTNTINAINNTTTKAVLPQANPTPITVKQNNDNIRYSA